MLKIGIDMFGLAAGLGGSSGLPSNALTLNGKALTLNGKVLTLGA